MQKCQQMLFPKNIQWLIIRSMQSSLVQVCNDAFCICVLPRIVYRGIASFFFFFAARDSWVCFWIETKLDRWRDFAGVFLKSVFDPCIDLIFYFFFIFVVRRWCRSASRFWFGRRRVQNCCNHKTVPYTIAHDCRSGWYKRRVGQHGTGWLEISLLWHSQGIRLAGWPGRHSLHDPRSTKSCHRIGKLRHAILTNQRGQNLSACIWWPELQLRQGWTGSSLLCRGRSYRTFIVAHIIWPVAELRLSLFRRIFRIGFDIRKWQMCRCVGDVSGRWQHSSVPCQQHGARYWWLWTRLLLLHVGAYMHRWRYRHGCQTKLAMRRFGIRSIPSNR